jgi:hypothetical protein
MGLENESLERPMELPKKAESGNGQPELFSIASVLKLQKLIWRQWAPDAHGQAMKGGHFFPEENPDDTALLLKQFLCA